MDITQLSVVPDISFSKEDEDKGIFSGYAAVFGLVENAWNPYGGGVYLESGAFKKTLSERKTPFKVLWNHNTDLPIGNTLDISEDNRGLKFSAKLNLDIRTAREVFSNIKAGVVDEMSIGFTPIKYAKDDETGDVTFNEVRLSEISPVSFPANPAARISSVMNAQWSSGPVGYQNLDIAPIDTPWNRADAESRIREWSESSDDNIYRSGFLWADSNEDKTIECKLPIGDIVDGNLVAIPGGLFAAAALIESHSAQIKQAEANQLRMVLGRYYNSMNITPPWQRDGALNADEINALIEIKLDALRAHAEPVTTRNESESTHDVDEPLDKGLTDIVRIIKNGQQKKEA